MEQDAQCNRGAGSQPSHLFTVPIADRFAGCPCRRTFVVMPLIPGIKQGAFRKTEGSSPIPWAKTRRPLSGSKENYWNDNHARDSQQDILRFEIVFSGNVGIFPGVV
ncbi:MAG TPA: hypothetical protein VK658_00960 [Chryseolinea sp.]|nr:hypothetical protein [Chryseolinea sp.]